MNRRPIVPVLLLPVLIALAPVVVATDQAPPAVAPAPPAVVPTPLAATASPSAKLAEKEKPPFVVPKATGKIEVPAGKTNVVVEDKVSKLHPTSYTFTSPGGGKMFWIGVTSPKSDVFLSAFEHKTKKPILGTLPGDSASRVLLGFDEPTELLLVAHTTSDGTPFRFEVNLGNMSL